MIFSTLIIHIYIYIYIYIRRNQQIIKDDCRCNLPYNQATIHVVLVQNVNGNFASPAAVAALYRVEYGITSFPLLNNSISRNLYVNQSHKI